MGKQCLPTYVRLLRISKEFTHTMVFIFKPEGEEKVCFSTLRKANRYLNETENEKRFEYVFINDVSYSEQSMNSFFNHLAKVKRLIIINCSEIREFSIRFRALNALCIKNCQKLVSITNPFGKENIQLLNIEECPRLIQICIMDELKTIIIKNCRRIHSESFITETENELPAMWLLKHMRITGCVNLNKIPFDYYAEGIIQDTLQLDPVLLDQFYDDYYYDIEEADDEMSEEDE